MFIENMGLNCHLDAIVGNGVFRRWAAAPDLGVPVAKGLAAQQTEICTLPLGGDERRVLAGDL